jgi:hypothetical protein
VKTRMWLKQAVRDGEAMGKVARASFSAFLFCLAKFEPHRREKLGNGGMALQISARQTCYDVWFIWPNLLRTEVSASQECSFERNTEASHVVSSVDCTRLGLYA